MGPAFRLQIARAFAPQLRFNAFYPGNSSLQNRSEDLFPMGVASFFSEIHNGQARVLVQGSHGTTPGLSQQRTVGAPASMSTREIGPYPAGMVGDAPGAAPLYINLYEEPTARTLDSQGRGEIVVHAEYWIFYPQDRADVQILGLSTQLLNDPFGHQGDWEHVALRLRLRLGQSSRFLDGQVEEGYFAAHGDVFRTQAPELELVDDLGAPDPNGSHPVVYVAQGKHGSYPQAGERQRVPAPSWLANYVDFFRGNGVRVDAWSGSFFDLEDPTAAPQEFNSPEFQTIMASSPTPPSLADWTEFQGKWGPTRNQLTVFGHTFSFASSPTGPKRKSDYGDFGRSAVSWTDAKRQQSGTLTVYRDQGVTIPLSSPVPLPVRR
jgi:hypothetical protein